MEAADSDEEVVEEVIDDEDKVAKTDPSFRIWQNSLFAQNNCMRIILKFADYLDKSSKEGSSDDDDDFEDCEEMDEDSAAQAQVIDLDSSKQACLATVASLLDHVLLRTQPLPQIIGLQRATADALDELQETSFAVLTSLLFSCLPQVKHVLTGTLEGHILDAIFGFL